MKCKKVLLALTLSLCALLCMAVTASASEVKVHSHYLCGDASSCTAPEIHKETTPTSFTTPLTSKEGVLQIDGTPATILTYTSGYNLDSGSYYLAENLELGKEIYVTGNVTLCLNGKKISYNGAGIFASNGGGLIYIAGGAALTICDCKNTGCIKYEKTQNYDEISTIHSWGTLNLYGGTISRMNTNNNGHAIRTRSGSKLNMYGGTVSNDGTEAALWLENDANIYGGEITCTNGRGISTYSGSNRINLLVAGGRISAEKEAIDLSATVLTLSGQPEITSAGTDSAVIDTGARIIKIADSFAPVHCISVSKSGNNDTFAEPVEGGASLADKAQYFTSFEDGKFVAYGSAANTLYLTACAITQQPTSGNSYTVKGNAPDSKLNYRWYAAKKGDIPVTDAVAKKSADASYWKAWTEWRVKCGDEIDCFTLYMNEGDVLTLSNISGGQVSEVSIPGAEVTGDDWNYKFTAPAAGEYTLKISATGYNNYYPEDYSGDYYLNFKAALQTFVPDTANPAGGTAAVLDTAGLSAGEYICQVIWEGKSTVNSGVVRFSGSSQQPSSGGYYYAGPTVTAVLNGPNKSATDYPGGDYGLIFRAAASYSGFQGVQVDGKTLAASNYTVEDNGGIEVYLKAVYLRTLAVGKHTVTILSAAGNVSMDFTVGGTADAPKTFDAGIGAYAVTALLSLGGMAYVGRKRR